MHIRSTYCGALQFINKAEEASQAKASNDIVQKFAI